jgi:hypothetical protein
MDAIRIIRDEHRSLAAVLDGMLYFVHQIRDRGAEPDFNLLGAMIYYIDTVPERFHHPKEEEYLFRLLRLRQPDAAAVLAEKHLTGEDWDVIDAAFLGHSDPMFGAETGAEREALFGRILKLAPPPIGMAPPR